MNLETKKQEKLKEIEISKKLKNYFYFENQVDLKKSKIINETDAQKLISILNKIHQKNMRELFALKDEKE